MTGCFLNNIRKFFLVIDGYGKYARPAKEFESKNIYGGWNAAEITGKIREDVMGSQLDNNLSPILL